MMRDKTLERTALKGTKYTWVRSFANLEPDERRELGELRRQYKRLGRAWSIKEHFSEFWRYRRESAARRFLTDWFRWATHSQLPEMINVAYTL
jgi:transposase